MFIQKTDASNACGCITDNGKFLGMGVKSEIGNGKFWYHNWATNLSLIKFYTRSLPPNIEDAMIEESWNKWKLLACLLPENSLKLSASFEMR